ncbi:MAG: hypothetical protein WA294_19700 [Acidobacteriaceae bacterium]
MKLGQVAAKAVGLGNPSVLLAVTLLCISTAAMYGQGGIAFWETPAAKQEAMLSQVPADDAGRLAALRRYFIDAGCMGDHLTEQPLDPPGKPGGKKKRRAPANLVCTLPGESAQAVVVAVWYPEHSLYGGVTRGWPEAVALPMLYRALRAQPRRFTFVLAELSGDEGERVFLTSLADGTQGSVLCLVGLDALGVGDPQFYSVPRKQVPSAGWPVMDTLEREALRIAQLQGYGLLQQYLQAMGPMKRSIYPNKLIDAARDMPRVLVYSGFRMAATPAAFRQDFDFTAYYLCAIDRQLNRDAPAPR